MGFYKTKNSIDRDLKRTLRDKNEME